MVITDILTEVSKIVAYLIGGTVPAEAGQEVPTVITFAESWVGSFVNVIVSNPLFLIFAIVSLVFLGINTVRRLMSV